jgi:ribosomal protein S18 acetylase RimI-like enzyme
VTPGVVVRPAGMSDVPAAFAVSAAFAEALHGQADTTIEHLRMAWDYGHAWVALDAEERVIGYATLEDGYVEVWPHPAAGPDVAEALLDAAGRRGGPMETIVPAAAEGLVALFRGRGWAQTREVLRMQADVADRPAAPAWPPAVGVRTYEPDDAQAVHALLEAAFAEGAEEVPPFARWHPWMTNDPSFDAGVWFLAEAGDELAGVCLCWREGWIKDLAVRPALRGRGLGEALLRHALTAFHERGLGTVGLKVDADNPTGAVRLYERAGMTLDRRYLMFATAAPKGV